MSLSLKKLPLLLCLILLEANAFCQTDFCSFRYDTLNPVRSFGYDTTHLSEANTPETIKQRLSTSSTTKKVIRITDSKDSLVLWVYFKICDSLFVKNQQEQFYLHYDFLPCRKPTLYGFEGDKLVDSVVYADRQYHYLSVVPLKTLNNHPKEWLFKLPLLPNCRRWDAELVLSICTQQGIDGEKYELTKTVIPIILTISILAFMTLLSVFLSIYSVQVDRWSYLIYAFYTLSHLPYLVYILYEYSQGYYWGYWSFLINFGEPLSAYLTAFFYFWFIMRVLNLRVKQPKYYKRLFYINGIYLLFLGIHLICYCLHWFDDSWIYYAFRGIQWFPSLYLVRILWRLSSKYLAIGALLLVLPSVFMFIFYQDSINIPIERWLVDVFFYLSIIIEIFFMTLSLTYKIQLLKDKKDYSETTLNMLSSYIHAKITNGLNLLLWDLDNDSMTVEQTKQAVEDLFRKSQNSQKWDDFNKKPIVQLLQSNDMVHTLEKRGVHISHNIEDTAAQHIEAIAQAKLIVHAKLNIYLIYTEILNNVIKYAECQHVETQLYQDAEKCIWLCVKDDGVGFDVNNPNVGNGLGYLKESATLLGGKISIEAAPNQGTKVCLSIPLGKPKKRFLLRGAEKINRWTMISFFLFYANILFAQNKSLPFSISPELKLEENEVNKKKEGLSFDVLPQLGFDYLNGINYGLIGSIFNNDFKNDTLFYYANYKWRINFSIGNSYKRNQKKLIDGDSQFAMSLEAPYLFRSRFRLKGELNLEKNPNNSYFGINTNTLKAINQLVGNGDDLYNSYKQNEVLANLNIEMPCFKGFVWTYLGFEYSNEFVYTQKNSLLNYEDSLGIVRGLGKSITPYLRLGIKYDSRNNKDNPTKGMVIELAYHVSPKFISFPFMFSETLLHIKYFQKLNFRHDNVIAIRYALGKLNGTAPFYAYQDVWSSEGDISTLGGDYNLRGFVTSRFVGNLKSFLNFELRSTFLNIDRVKNIKQAPTHTNTTDKIINHYEVSLVPFFDIGGVWDNNHDYFKKLGNYRFSGGVGMRFIVNNEFVIRADYGISKENKLFILQLDHTF